MWGNRGNRGNRVTNIFFASDRKIMFVGRKFFFPREEKITPLSDFYGYLGYPGYLLCLYLESPPPFGALVT